jgi:hypothetical protein
MPKGSARKVVYVGDSVWDVRAAKALAIGFLGLAAADKAGRLLAEGASCVVTDFSDPLHVVECLDAVARKPEAGCRHERPDPPRNRP